MDNKTNKMLIDATHPEETRVVVLREGRVEEFDYESAARKLLRGNIYLAKVTRVEPSLQAAFVDYGGNRHGFLAFNEIHPDYYQIPVADRQALLQEDAEAEAEAEAVEDDAAVDAAPEPTGDAGPEAATDAPSEQPRSRREQDGMPVAETASMPGRSSHDANPGPAMASDVGAAPDGEPAADRPAEPELPTTPSEPREPPRTMALMAAPSEVLRASPGTPAYPPAGPEAADPAAGTDAPIAAAPLTPPEADDQPVHTSRSRRRRRGETNGGDSDGEGVIEIETEESSSSEVVEEVGSEDALEEVPERRHRRQRARTYKIQEVIKRRQIMLVQVVKEERGSKGAALTTYLSLAGRYTVLMPNTNRGGGISRKITDPADRKRLKRIAQELEVPEGMGLIIRTAGASRTKADIKRDFEYLLRLWENIRDLTLQSTAPALVYAEGDLIKRSIRDLYAKDIEEIVVAGEEAYDDARDFMRMLMPSHTKNVIRYEGAEPLFSRYPIERQLNAMFSPYVTLKSGGYLVINQTEALVSIDVNSGKATREFSIEETALNTNLEAADEIARQLKLRDLAGLIVIDFIDMEEKRNNRAVERRLKEALRFDRARIQVGRISHFGLLEMSRQRLRTGVVEGSTSQCPHCQGTGVVRSTESVALAVLRALEDALIGGDRSNVTALTTASVALYILNEKRTFINDMESRYGVRVSIEASDRVQGSNFQIQRSARQPAEPAPNRRSARGAAVQMDWAFGDDGNGGSHAAEEADIAAEAGAEADTDQDHEPDPGSDDGEGDPRPRRRRRRRGRGRGEREGYTASRERAADEPASDQAHGRTGGATMDDHDFGAARGNGGEVAVPSGAVSLLNDDMPYGDIAPADAPAEPADGDSMDAGDRTEEPGGRDDRGGRRRRRGRRGGRRRDREDQPDATSQEPGFETALEPADARAELVAVRIVDEATLEPAAAPWPGTDVSVREPVASAPEPVPSSSADERPPPAPGAGAGPRKEIAAEPQPVRRAEQEPPAPAPQQGNGHAEASRPRPPHHHPVSDVVLASDPNGLVAVPPSAADDPSRPRRKGWWQRKFGG